MNKELLRFTTAGSVDDGKSTLIGRLLYDSKAIFQDQLDSLEMARMLRGDEAIDLALLTDGLRAEREQGITIDVAYRYFATPKRKFIIADTPGHEQYTRNMVTGASTADLAIVLIDARKGVLEQSKRHGFLASLLGIPHMLVGINKMDLVDYSEEVFNDIVAEYVNFSEKLNVHDITFIPISALYGDNIVTRSTAMDWYDGNTVLHHLENITIAADKNMIDFRFPVQHVIRPHQDFRGFAGRIASGSVKVGEEVVALPSGVPSRVKEIVTFDEKKMSAHASQSVVITLEDEIDLSRGEMLVRKNNIPKMVTHIEAVVCWFDHESTLQTDVAYYLQHTTRSVRAYVRDVRYRINVNQLHREKTTTLSLNEIGRIHIETAEKIFCDPYDVNRETGSFILIDPVTNNTVAAGMLRHDSQTADNAFDQSSGTQTKSDNVVWEDKNVSLAERETRQGHKAHVVWLTGLSGAGKSTIAKMVEKKLFDEGKNVFLLDGDNVRHGLNGDLGFSEEDRKENIRRVGHTARLLFDAGCIVLCAFISPNKQMREYVRGLFPDEGFSEVYVKCDLDTCRSRDVKGLYARAEKGEIPSFTGISAPYDEPNTPELVINTDELGLAKSIDALSLYLNEML